MYNKIILIGRLTKDPELSYTGNGNAICKYGLAVNRSYKNSQGQYDCDFFDITTWRKLGEISAKYLKKGKLVMVEGEMQSRKYVTQEGAPRTAWEVSVKDMKMLSPKENSDSAPAAPSAHPAAPQRKNPQGKSLQVYSAPPPPEDTYEEIDFNEAPF